MPGSSTPSPRDPPKAKVTSAATDGIFVRPVAVAGIFRPAHSEDDGSRPPALPEKRRFSALVGDLRPCSSGDKSASDDFARRRQSWDTRQKEAPFGQSLLRKTPRQTEAPVLKTVTSAVVQNGSQGEPKVSPVAQDSPLQSGKTEHKSTLVSEKSNTNRPSVEPIPAVVSNGDQGLKCDKTDVTSERLVPKQRSVISSEVGKATVSANSDSNIVSDAKLVTASTVENTTNKTKKVYGLVKRESKSEIQTGSVGVGKELNDSSVVQKFSAAKIKVYGLNRANGKKDPKPDRENELQQAREFLKSSLPSVESANGSAETAESKVATESNELGNENRATTSPPKDLRTVRRTSDVIAAKIQNIFSTFQSEKPAPSLPKKTKIPDKVSSLFPKPSAVVKDENSKKEVSNKTGVPGGKIDASSTSSTVNNSDSEFKTQPPLDVKRTQELNITVSKVKHFDSKSSSGKSSSESNVLRSKPESPPKQDVCTTKKSESSGPQPVKSDLPFQKADSKTETSIKFTSKQVNNKIPNSEGKMPIKKDDQSSSDCTKGFVKATNQEADRKSSNPTAPSSVMFKGASEKKLPSVATAGPIERKPLQWSVTSLSANSPPEKEVTNCDLKTFKNSNGFERIFTQSASNKTTSSSESIVSSHSVQLTNSTTYKCSTSSETTKILKKSDIASTCANGISSNEISKVEVAKLTTVPGIVPTVNVLFRTKSPQGPSNREENRKKVVIETCSNDASAPVSSASIISPKPLPSTASQSVEDALKAVESAQLVLNSSPKAHKHHIITNLQKEEVITVDLSSSNRDSCGKTEIPISCTGARSKHSSLAEIPTSFEDTNLKIAYGQQKSNVSLQGSQKIVDTVPASANGSNCLVKDAPSVASSSSSGSFHDSMSVVDLGDWNKRFQRVEPEAPRAPVRRRALRDSLPPSLPTRSVSRFGSLRRIDDPPRYLPRSPSQSSIPQRYSYTEMLSKVCSMGVLPYVEPAMSTKSCSSSSSQVSELWSELSEEQNTSTHASEMLEAETTERMRLEKETHELQNRFSQMQQRSDKMEMEIMESRVYRTSELNGDLSEDDEPDNKGSLYKQKYDRAVRDMEMMKRRFLQQHEEEVEQKAMMKKASDKRLAEALEDVDEERQVASQWKRKAQKAGAELQDLRLMLEEQMARNGELEKKQRRFDAELSAAQEEIKKEKALREKLMRDKDQAITEKYSLEQDLQATKIDSDMLHEKIAQLNREIDELSLSSKGEEEVTQLKRAKQELERKARDQEEELEELAAQVGMLEQAKLRLEMSLEKVRQEHRREASVREEEIEEIRASFSKKIKNLEAQLESEQDERHQLVKQKHELERRLYEIADQPPPHDPEIERRLRRDLKRTKALLRDAQSMLEHTREGQSSKTLIRQLKNQLEDSEFAKATAIKARQAVETELQDCQIQLEEITRTKNEAETRCLQLSREKSGIQTQLEETEEEMAEVMKKYKAVVAQMSVDQKALAEQTQQIAELENERQLLKDQLSDVSHKFEHLAGQSDDTHKVHWLDSKIRDLESKMELEQTTRTRLENQINRLKEQNDKAREECDSLRNKEVQAQEAVRRLQRQIRDLREDYSALQQKEADGYRKQHEMEMALENTETDLQVTKNDLRLACQRIQDLQNALEDDLDSGTDVPDDSGSDSDSSFELSVLRNQSVTPIQRCESIASNLSYDTEGGYSRTGSFSQELSAFSSRDDVEKDFKGFSGLNSTALPVDTQKDDVV